MINNTMLQLGKKSSIIREIFEYGKKRKLEIGDDNVFDFSLGNPSIPTPATVTNAMTDILKNVDPVKLHGYTSAPGDIGVRRAIADSISKRFDFPAKAENMYMTCGAAASLTVSLKAIVNNGDEIIVLSPYFPEYRVFAEGVGANVVEVPCNSLNFTIDLYAIKNAVTKFTKAIIINSPNNPTGVVFDKQSIYQLSKLLEEKEREYNKEIYIIADEPYRELVYDVDVPYIPEFYKNTIVCYSYSKSLSLPGERIGYIFVSPLANNSKDLFNAVCGAGRTLGFVCAPSLMQYTIGSCLDETSEISQYRKNRDLLYSSLVEYGFDVVKPQGAFYLFVRSPIKDAVKFCEEAKKYELLLVPSDDFGLKGYVRISYCVSYKQIKNSLTSFKKLISGYKG